MITKEQALELHCGKKLHCTLRHPCRIIVGPRGGRKELIDHVRVSGRCKTWKTRPDDFRIPVKYGLYESLYIDHDNAHDFHLAEDCPAVEEKRERSTYCSYCKAKGWYRARGHDGPCGAPQ